MTKKSGANLVVVVFLLLVIIIAIAFIVKRTTTPKAKPRLLDWTCEECGHRFVAERNNGQPRVCPQPECGGQAVRTYYYYCSVHNHLFEAFRSKPNPEVDSDIGEVERLDMAFLYKVPGGQWVTEYPKPITCPQGNSDPKTFKYCPPGAKERQEKAP